MSSVSSAVSPLTTVFTPPAGCLDNIYAAPFNGTTLFGLGAPCGSLNDSCFPPQVTPAASASLFDLQPFVYSPGIDCPSGYTTATTTNLAPSVTGAACCPSGLVPSGVVCEGFPKVPFSVTGCDDLPTTYTDPATTVTVSAGLIVLAWESSDLVQTASVESSTTGTQTQGSDNSTSTPSIGVISSGGPLPTIQLSTQSFTASTSKSTSSSRASSRPRKGWNVLIFCGLAATALLS